MAGGESARARRTTPRRRSASRATRAPAHIERIDLPLGERTAPESAQPYAFLPCTSDPSKSRREAARAGGRASCSMSGRKSTRRSPSGAMSTAPGDKVNAQRPPQRAQSHTSFRWFRSPPSHVWGQTVFDVEPQLPACRRRPPGVAVVDAPAREGGSECRVGTRVGAIVGRGGGGDVRRRSGQRADTSRCRA